VIEKGPTCCGQRDALGAAGQELRTDLILKIPDLSAQGRLGRVQPFLGCNGEAALLGDRDENTEDAAAPFRRPMLVGYALSLQSLSHCRNESLPSMHQKLESHGDAQ